MNIRNNIRELRERKHFTLKLLASELDISISTLNRMENGIIKQFKPELLIKLSELLNCGVGDLFREGVNNKAMPFSKEELYKELIATKDRRIKDLERQLNSTK
jgi:transcriptional regulator with XRE-family HTH domain